VIKNPTKISAKAWLITMALFIAGLQAVAQTTPTVPGCNCSTDMYVIANPGVFKIRCGQTHLFDMGTNITLIPQNICTPANCLSEWAINAYDAQTGVHVKGGKGVGNASGLGITLNSNAGFRVELDGSCNGHKCHCEFWIKPKPH